MAFPEPEYMKAVIEIGTTYPTVANGAMCADACLAIAGTACCDPNNNNLPKNIYASFVVNGQHMIQQSCAAKQMDLLHVHGPQSQ
eukprot:15221142-Ditylum_brightwellii.AAC.2